jgi:hypothetical protein
LNSLAIFAITIKKTTIETFVRLGFLNALREKTSIVVLD